MGARGPRPLPTEVLKARGSRRADLNKQEPRPPTGALECPDWIDDLAKQVWAQMVPILQAMGVLTIADVNTLVRYCQLWSRWKKCEEFIQKYGETYPIKSGTGTVKCFGQWPQVGIATKLSLALTKIEQEFGLTPSARSRIRVDPRFLARTPESNPPRPMTEEERKKEEYKREFFAMRARMAAAHREP